MLPAAAAGEVAAAAAELAAEARELAAEATELAAEATELRIPLPLVAGAGLLEAAVVAAEEAAVEAAADVGRMTEVVTTTAAPGAPTVRAPHMTERQADCVAISLGAFATQLIRH